MRVQLLVNLKRKNNNRVIQAGTFDDKNAPIPPEVLREVELNRWTVKVINDDRPKTTETTTMNEDVAKTEVTTTEETSTKKPKSGRRKKK